MTSRKVFRGASPRAQFYTAAEAQKVAKHNKYFAYQNKVTNQAAFVTCTICDWYLTHSLLSRKFLTIFFLLKQLY